MYLKDNGLCRYVNDKDFMEWMIGHDTDLRNAYEKRFGEIVRATEEYAMAKDWSQEFKNHAVSGFFQLLRDFGVLKGVDRAKIFTVVLSQLYFYIGLLTLDRAASMKRL
jgi:hypothetical protein